jgi:hypothetical protein
MAQDYEAPLAVTRQYDLTEGRQGFRRNLTEGGFLQLELVGDETFNIFWSSDAGALDVLERVAVANGITGPVGWESCRGGSDCKRSRQEDYPSGYCRHCD